MAFMTIQHYFLWCPYGFYREQPKYQCICESGWEAPAGNPSCVSDVNECNLPNKPCSTNPAAPCYNTQGSFYCGACPAGEQPAALQTLWGVAIVC